MSETSSTPLRSILDVRRSELPLALLMFGYFFLVITTFWILKPVKKALFVGFYDERGVELFGTMMGAAQAEQVAKVANMLVAVAAVIVFTILSRKLVRQQLTLIFSGFFIAGFLLFAFTARDPSHWSAWSFYLFGDLYSTLMVATFFAFLNDSVTPSAARRLYGLVVLGGVAGGGFGALFVATWTKEFGFPIWMFICVGIAVVIGILAVAAGKIVDRGEIPAVQPEPSEASDKEAAESDDDSEEHKKDSEEHKKEEGKQKQVNPAIEGARLVFRSRYLLAIVLIVALYEIVSTILDFQFTATIAHYLDGEALEQQFANVYAISAGAALVVQVFLTTPLMNRFRLTIPLLVTPVAILTGSAAFLLFPLLWPGSLLNTWDNALNYSINQSAREALYTTTSRDAKYKAKAFIDMFVQRFAKALAVGINLGVTLWFATFSSVRWLSAVAIGLTLVWALAARSAGRRFHARSEEGESPRESAPS